jgi:hypothetical protein
MGVFYEYAAHFMNRGSLINVALERRTAAVGGTVQRADEEGLRRASQASTNANRMPNT